MLEDSKYCEDEANHELRGLARLDVRATAQTISLAEQG